MEYKSFGKHYPPDDDQCNCRRFCSEVGRCAPHHPASGVVSPVPGVVSPVRHLPEAHQLVFRLEQSCGIEHNLEQLLCDPVLALQVPFIGWFDRLPRVQGVVANVAPRVTPWLFGHAGRQFFLRDVPGGLRPQPILVRTQHSSEHFSSLCSISSFFSVL